MLPLTIGKTAVVDEDLFPLVSAFKWTTAKRRNGQRFYAYRNVRMEDGSLKSLFLHQVVAGIPLKKGMAIDHIDGDGLNNCRSNLRLVCQGENLTNSNARRQGRTHSAFPGVTWHKGKGRWYSRIQINGVSRHLGSFVREQDAANAYLNASRARENQYGNHYGVSERA